MTDVPLISVLMPVRNAQRYVAQAIDSVLDQSVGDFELIITDDGSTDDTVKIVRQYAERDPRIRFDQQANAGTTRTLNRQITLARGEFLARMDADDISLPQRFEKQLAFLRERPDYVLVGCQALLIDPDGRIICPKRGTPAEHEEIDKLLLGLQWPLVHPAVLMRIDAVRRLKGYDEQHPVSQDHDLFLRLAEIGKLANLPDILLHYRQHFHSTVFTKSADHRHHLVEICRKAYVRRGLPLSDLKKPQVDHMDPISHRRNWAWWALESGNLSTARHHAAAVLRSAPLAPASWRLTYC